MTPSCSIKPKSFTFVPLGAPYASSMILDFAKLQTPLLCGQSFQLSVHHTDPFWWWGKKHSSNTLLVTFL